MHPIISDADLFTPQKVWQPLVTLDASKTHARRLDMASYL